MRDAAYYQPKQFIELVEYVKEHPTEFPEDPRFLGWYNYEHKDVLNELPGILRRVCYHLDYLPHCVDLIWGIGRGDKRETNPYPEHGIRILQDLAKYDIYEISGKSIAVHELMLDAVKRWLADPNLADYHYSPLDIIDKLLEKELTTDTYERGTVTIHSFSVHYENTKYIREKH